MSSEEVKKLASQRIGNITKKMEKISIAPGEYGNFQKWGKDIFIEEKCFPHLFPYGVGGYMSSMLDGKDSDMGFSNYVRHRLLHVDPRYRKDVIYVFFLLLVKEYVELERCKQTYLRQARIIPSLTLAEIANIKHENLTRHNRSFQVFRPMRGTTPYYEHAKKNVMAILRQLGSPTCFFTMACAEYKWNNLLQQILQVNERRKVDLAEVEQMNSSEKNKLLSENAVISTVHFHKRVEKLFKIFRNCDIFEPYSLEDYYIRVEFQARGAPHIHCLLWLSEKDENDGIWKPLDTMFTGKAEKSEGDVTEIIKKMEIYAKNMISASVNNLLCKECKKNIKDYPRCNSDKIESTVGPGVCSECNKIK